MDQEVKQIINAFFFPTLFIAIIWLIWILQVAAGDVGWYELGIYPRRAEGLTGILTSPLIHSSLGHIFNNSVSILILGWLLSYSYKELKYMVFLVVWLLSGIFTWLIGRDAWHIGASGLVYALSFFLFFSGIFRRYVPLMATSLIVAFLYGSGVWSIFPIAELVDPSISWEGHLSGAISGLIAAILFRKQGPQKVDPFEDEDDDENAIWKQELTDNR
ncbi:MAG: rhomboid family intramembrane serine protease [Prevotellaceae bacterium]|jgi:membrane associated rhomboid family serine protease|nr:rhomboid family intramembrane serine protease [Prevotellaceae bacterium]